ncbi:MAG: class I tRNA ligase family protein, partial [Candidatus Colwellbacteria bacterium]|nr:class I tRNA ligase family protein [Candidatus Colwellbacteria bacterium]
GIIKQFHNKKLLYKGHKVVPHCPRCGTSLSSHEVAQGYEDVTEPSVYVKFRLLHGKFKDSFLIAWTTTPWTLPGNVALAVAKNLTYVWIAAEDEKLIVAKSALSRLGLENSKVIDEFNGSELLAEKYQPLFDVLKPNQKTSRTHSVMAADFVNVEEGSGVVHTAVMYGEDDYQLGEHENLPKIHTVAEDGTFKDFVKPFAGTFVKDADKAIIKDLNDRGLVLKVENYTHSYPFCWRCGTVLLYYAKDSWFVKMSSLRDELIKNNSKVTWVPDHLRDGRFGEFLKEAKDWAFSRERYWGTPLPVWMCENGHVKVLGSAEELKLEDLHRPFIDEVTFECGECQKTMHRESYVCDVWFDSGSMPYASGEKNAGRFPADFIAEAIDMTRGWF